MQHKGKSVDELLTESVFKHLEHSNYNSTTEITILLETLGFDVSKHNRDFAAIQEMIERRHQIVHRADWAHDANAAAAIQSINIDEVGAWMNATVEFTFSLNAALIDEFIRLERSERKPGA